MLFLTTLHQHSQTNPNKVALEYHHHNGIERVTYGRLEQFTQQTMHYLHQLGVQQGDRVAVQLPKCIPFIYLYLATIRMGAIFLPLNPAYPEQELTYFLENAGVKLLFGDTAVSAKLATLPQTLPQLQPPITLSSQNPSPFIVQLAITDTTRPLPPLPTNAEQTALMIYTSGTTGRPKGAQVSHGNLTANLNSLHQAWGWHEDDVLLHVLPIFHAHGLIISLQAALHAGATAVLLPKFDAKQTLDTLVQRRCTLFMGVPTIHRRLVEHPQATNYDLSHMRLLTSGSDRLPNALFQRFQDTFGHTLLERYGMTETCINLSNPLHGERRVGSVGLPLPQVEARIADANDIPLPNGKTGEVQIRGPHVFKGYWQKPAETAAAFTADGWLKTGDLGEQSPDGYFTLKGRAKDLIITGGLNVYPPEVERVLALHPAVQYGVVIGCPDEEWGERVTAVIIPHPKHTLTDTDIIAHCRQHLAPYKAPKKVIFVENLPSNALGKIQKAQLRRSLCLPS